MIYHICDGCAVTRNPPDGIQGVSGRAHPGERRHETPPIGGVSCHRSPGERRHEPPPDPGRLPPVGWVGQRPLPPLPMVQANLRTILLALLQPLLASLDSSYGSLGNFWVFIWCPLSSPPVAGVMGGKVLVSI